MSDEEPSFEDNEFRQSYIENTEEYERALTALLTPRGRRLSEIAEREAIDDLDVLRTIARRLVLNHSLLVESDGQKDDPRVYRNYMMGFFGSAWREFTLADDKYDLVETADELEDTIEGFREETGFERAEDLRQAISDGEVEHLDADDTGEVFWDVYTDWADAAARLRTVNFVHENYGLFLEGCDTIDMDVDGQFGDFSNYNAIEAKLGIDEQPPDESELLDDGTLEYPDEDAGPYKHWTDDEE